MSMLSVEMIHTVKRREKGSVGKDLLKNQDILSVFSDAVVLYLLCVRDWGGVEQQSSS